MSDVLANLATIERALAERVERLAKFLVDREDAAMRKGSRVRAAAVQILQDTAAISVEAFLEIPMAQREEMLAEAMTNARHVFMEDLSKAQRDVAMLRLDIGDKWLDPDVMDSYIFMVSEVGEVGDALLRANFGHGMDYSRNNTKYVGITDELGDVYLMLCTLATALGVDLDNALQCCIDRLRGKYDTT